VSAAEPDHLDGLPLLLRREAFGGLLFAPREAVHIELDHEAFEFVHAHLTRQRAPSCAEEQHLLERLRAELGVTEVSRTRTVEYGRAVDAYPFQVYNAPTLADFQITTRCTMGCRHCYAAAEPDGVSVPLADVTRVLSELERNGVTQIALGGGEPLDHPDLIQILELCHGHGLVPNLTSNGLGLDREKLAALKRYCGAVALSLEGVGERFSRLRGSSFAAFEARLARLVESGVATVLQVTLSRETFADLDAIVAFCLQQPRLYGVIFLAYKQVGRGLDCDHLLSELEPAGVHEKLRDAFLRLSRQIRVGYDCCLTPGIVGVEPTLGFSQEHQLEGCSALRSSVGILPSLDVTPCTFSGDLVVGNLADQPLHEIWRGEAAQAFRGQMRRHYEGDARCVSCASKLDCLGGCALFDLVRCRQRPGSRARS